jgi:dTDP-glucose 4,6-dehydratase
MASQSHVDTSITDPVPFVENNMAVALNTLELARKLRPEAVVMISTDEVYGPAEPGHAHREWDAILPSNPYAASKAAQEAVSISYWRTYGIPVVITNTMNMIGERQHAEKYVPKVLRAVLAGKEAVIHGSPGNIGSRHYLHARNMADAVLFLLRGTLPSMFPAHLAPGSEAAAADRPDRYNIASADRISNLELAQMIAAAAGMPLRYRWEDFHRTRPGHDPHYGLDPGKISALGWKPPVPFAASLERTIRWTMRHPEWLMSLPMLQCPDGGDRLGHAAVPGMAQRIRVVPAARELSRDTLTRGSAEIPGHGYPGPAGDDERGGRGLPPAFTAAFPAVPARDRAPDLAASAAAEHDSSRGLPPGSISGRAARVAVTPRAGVLTSMSCLRPRGGVVCSGDRCRACSPPG